MSESQVVLSAETDRRLKSIGMVSYGLHAICAVCAILPGAQMGPLMLIIALVIDFVKRDDARGTWQESHFKWRINSVLIALVLYAVTIPLWLLFVLPGYVAWTLISIYFAYRIVRGWLNLADRQPIGDSEPKDY